MGRWGGVDLTAAANVVEGGREAGRHEREAGKGVCGVCTGGACAG